jgi:hypothetical protein
MTTHPQRRKRRRNRNRSGAPVVTWQPPGTDLTITNPSPTNGETIDGEIIEGEIVDGEVEALDPTCPDAADLITATGITLDHDGRRISVKLWRVAAIDYTHGRTWEDGLSPRVAGLLVGLTTRPGDTIVDFDNDPTLAGVASAHGVRHVPITRAAQLRRLPAGVASLITLRYPRPGPVTAPGELAEVFAACARLQTPRGSTVVAITPPAAGPDYATHAGQVIPAAEAAGLGYVEHVIAVTAPIPGERFTNLATPADRAVLRAARAALGYGRFHLDLLIFVLAGGRHD